MCAWTCKRGFFSLFILEQENSNETKSLSQQTKDPVPVGIDVLAGNFDGK